MTKIEYKKCERLMSDAIRKAKQFDEEYKAYNQLLNEDKIKAKIEQRKADQHYGEVIGIPHRFTAFVFFEPFIICIDCFYGF